MFSPMTGGSPAIGRGEKKIYREPERKAKEDPVGPSTTSINHLIPNLTASAASQQRPLHVRPNVSRVSCISRGTRSSYVHVIDFDAGQSLQWPGLLRSLASQGDTLCRVRITGVGGSKQELMETGGRLLGLVAALNLLLEFHSISGQLEDVRQWMLHVKEGETVVVRCVLKLHMLLCNPMGAAMRDFMGEGEHDGPDLEWFLTQFLTGGTGLPLGSAIRLRVEEMLENLAKCIVLHINVDDLLMKQSLKALIDDILLCLSCFIPAIFTFLRVPRLAVVIVVQRKDSQCYVNIKRKSCAEVGINYIDFDLPEDVSESKLISKVHELNMNPNVHDVNGKW
ncbi:GRAS family transcription factor [Striga asiatica]|uniref:GRAS family transcription factor n=1 Tax=Striga asiatica TaxID=4170 RepID=A0A5A7Q7F0_STRAF|nr:GRAS family transcription factor [Striga asiatica]